ncbi:MAG: L-dopachrome tautomerase-related protein, partial [Verrucomicrobiales bacterium]
MIVLSTLVGWCACLLTVSAGEFESWANPKAKLETSSRLMQVPGGMTITPSGSIILSVHQFQGANVRVVEITPSGELSAFPSTSMNKGGSDSPLQLDSVLGLQCDKKGVVWMLDNGRRSETTPKLVAWDTKADKLAKIIYLPTPVVIPTSFINDLALDPEEPYIYISDPAGGSDAALIVVNTESGLARRVLQGHYSVVPMGNDLLIDGKPVFAKRVDGTKVHPFAGVNPIAVDRKGDWVYYGPMDSTTLY